MSSFPLRTLEPVRHRLAELAALLGIPAPAKDLELAGVAPVATARGDQIGFVADRHYLPSVEGSGAGALLVAEELAGLLPEKTPPQLVVEDAHDALATLLEAFHPAVEAAPEVHPTAVLGRGVRIGRDVRIGPYVVVEAEAKLGDRCALGAHAVVGARARLGEDVLLHPHVVVYPDTEVGDRAILQSGARVGVEGFGFVFRGEGHEKIPQVGRCIIEPDVEVGANTTIDRGSIGETRVGKGAKLDNLIHLGHNVFVGPGAVFAAQVGVAGSTRIEAGVLAGGQAGIGGHLTVGKGAKLAGQAGVTSDVAPGETVMGFPARPSAQFLRGVAAQARMPDLLKKVRTLEARIAALSEPPADPEDR